MSTAAAPVAKKGDQDMDEVLDHLAQGEVYAEYGITAMYIQHAREVTDVTDAVAEDMGAVRHLSPMAQFKHERYKGAVYVPKLTNESKVMLTTVLLMMACLAILSALAAYAMKHLTGAIRYSYTDAGPRIAQAPVQPVQLMNQQAFDLLLEERPQETVSLYLKRAAAMRHKNDWQQAIRAFKSAALHSVTAIEISEHLSHVQDLINAGDTQEALLHLNSLDHERMGAAERETATALLGRLHFAVE